jgi:phosphoribosylformylglycinamidine synthase
MKREEIKVLLMRVGGTNCDKETQRAIQNLGAQAQVIHINKIIRNKQLLLRYDALVFPGGFSYGDYVRAGAIWAKWIIAKLGKEIKRFIAEEKPILGICNGFQVLVEMGVLPAFNGISEYPEAALATNSPPGYNCRWVYIRHENRGNCVFIQHVPRNRVLRIPVAHSEGRFIFPKENENDQLERLLENDQLVFRYCHPDGKPAEGEYPANPNGSFHDIAGICNPEGTVLGLMPHPERAFYWWQQPDWTRKKLLPQYGDGKTIFEGMLRYVERRF